MDLYSEETEESSKSLKSSKPEKTKLKEALQFNIRVAITDTAAFNRYILKEYAPRCQGYLTSNKTPAIHVLENCIYDEVAGWLDSPTITGLSILDIELQEKEAFPNPTLNENTGFSFAQIVDIMYDMCKCSSSMEVFDGKASLAADRFQDLVTRCKVALKHIDNIDFNEPISQTTRSKMGNSL